MSTAGVAQPPPALSNTPTLGVSYFARQALAGAICASSAHLALVPLDVIKTQIQLRIGSTAGFGEVARDIIRVQGYRGLFLGLSPTVVGFSLQGGAKFALFDGLKRTLPPVSGGEKVALLAAAAATAEVAASTLLCPFEALRIRQVAVPETFSGRGMLGGFRKVVELEGGGALFRGLVPIWLKQVPYTAAQLLAFTLLTDAAYQRAIPAATGLHKADLSVSAQLGVSLTCGVGAGVISSLVSQPGDTVLTRINAGLKKSMHSGAAAPGAVVRPPSVAAVVRSLGFWGLWSGTATRAALTGVLSAVMFLTYDGVKVVVGLPSSGSA